MLTCTFAVYSVDKGDVLCSVDAGNSRVSGSATSDTRLYTVSAVCLKMATHFIEILLQNKTEIKNMWPRAAHIYFWCPLGCTFIFNLSFWNEKIYKSTTLFQTHNLIV